jgi:hypothetical protein
MKLHYLEIVTSEVDAVCAAYAATHGVQFGAPEARLGTCAIYIQGGIDHGLWQE